MNNIRMLYGIRPPIKSSGNDANEDLISHNEDSPLKMLLCKIKKNEFDIKQAEFHLNDVKLRNRKVMNVLEQMLQEENCDHDWVGLYGHPGAYECQKCNKLKKS